MKNIKRNGFTLLELIATVFIFMIISVSAVSIIILGIKYNSVNRQSYNSDLISKSFIESLQSNSNRPMPQVKTGATLTSGLENGTYIVYFGDRYSDDYNYADLVDNYVKNNFSKNAGLNTTIIDPKTHLSDLISQVKGDVNKKKFTLVVKVVAKESGKIYDVDIWTWDTEKGDSSVVNRKKVINAKVT